MTEEENKMLQVIHSLGRAISRVADIQEIYQIILNEVAQVVGVERASIMQIDSTAQKLKVVAAKGLPKRVWESIEVPIGEGFSGQVFQTGEPMLVKDLKKEKEGGNYQTSSFICFPMKVGTTPIGVINLTDKVDGSPFEEEDKKLLTVIADQVGAYLHLTNLSKKLKETQRIRQQLEIARSIQRSLLPQEKLSTPLVDLAVFLLPAERVGADYYDYFWDEETKKLHVTIADVSGHDLGGAMIAAIFRTVWRSVVLAGASVEKIVESVNKILFEDLFRAGQFISMFYLVFEPATKKITYTSAGHNPALLWSARNKKGNWLSTSDCLLGIEPELNFHKKEQILETGDSLILYTDGLTEAKGSSGRFGTLGLEKWMSQSSEKKAEPLLESLKKTWSLFTGNQPNSDDVTIVVMRV